MIISRMLTLLFLYVIQNRYNCIATLNTVLGISLLHKNIYNTYSFRSLTPMIFWWSGWNIHFCFGVGGLRAVSRSARARF